MSPCNTKVQNHALFTVWKKWLGYAPDSSKMTCSSAEVSRQKGQGKMCHTVLRGPAAGYQEIWQISTTGRGRWHTSLDKSNGNINCSFKMEPFLSLIFQDSTDGDITFPTFRMCVLLLSVQEEMVTIVFSSLVCLLGIWHKNSRTTNTLGGYKNYDISCQRIFCK